ncbi:MAG: hypothetical protein KQI81_19705 [Deltaproteobacteria bacterium]|nr:hypothetical protein [Deltaproteobacteria bacterium]
MDENNGSMRVLYGAILRLLRPLVKLSLKKGISYGTFASLLKWVFYDVAKKELTLEGRKQTQSRISVITGFSRKEVKRLSELDPPSMRRQKEQYNRATRVISGWRRDNDYLDAQGQPIAIPITGNGATFEMLVKRFSGDMPPRAVLDELIRLGALEKESDNRVRLVQEAFMPTADEAIKFHILGTDTELLISTIDHNINPDKTTPFFQRKVYYDNLPDEILADFRRRSGISAQKLLDDLDRYLAINDRDVNPELEGTGRNIAGIGIYYFQKPFCEED